MLFYLQGRRIGQKPLQLPVQDDARFLRARYRASRADLRSASLSSGFCLAAFAAAISLVCARLAAFCSFATSRASWRFSRAGFLCQTAFCLVGGNGRNHGHFRPQSLENLCPGARRSGYALLEVRFLISFH